MRNVLRREYSGLFAIIAMLFGIEAVRDLLVEHEPAIDPAWLAIFVFGATAYVGLRWLKKHTRILNVEGR